MAINDVYPKMLSGAAPVVLRDQANAATGTQIFSVSTDYQWAVKQIIICNIDGIERLVSLSYNGDASVASNCFVYRLPVGPSDTVVLDTALIFEQGQVMRGLVDRDSQITVCVTGWERQIA